jgi:hypothetical protein
MPDGLQIADERHKRITTLGFVPTSAAENGSKVLISAAEVGSLQFKPFLNSDRLDGAGSAVDSKAPG